MDNEIIKIVNQNFIPESRESVINELSSITLEHVMANSEYNLKNTRLSILYLAQGDLQEVIKLTASAKIDFRDVFMWASQKANQT